MADFLFNNQEEEQEPVQPVQKNSFLSKIESEVTSDYEQRQVNREAYGVDLPDEVYKILNENVITKSDNPQDEAYKWGSAFKFSQMLGIPLQDAYDNLDNYNAVLSAKNDTPKGRFEAVCDMIKLGNNNVRIGMLGNSLMEAERNGDEELVKDIMAELDALEADNALRQDNTPRSWIMKALEAGAQSAPFTGYVAAAGLFGNFIAPAAGTAAAFATSAELARGQEYIDTRRNGSTPETSRIVSTVSGAIQGAVEIALGTVSESVSAGARIAGHSVKARIGETAVDKIVNDVAKRFNFGSGKKLLINYVTQYGRNIAEEGTEEFIQELTSIVGKEVAGALDGYDIPDDSIGEILKQTSEAFAGGVMGAITLGLVPTAINSAARIKDYNNVKQAAETIPSKEMFEKVVNENPVFSELEEAEKKEIIGNIWENARAAREAETNTRAKEIAEVNPANEGYEQITTDEETGETNAQPVFREDGKLYTKDVTVTEENGTETKSYRVGDPSQEGNNLYGNIEYTQNGNDITITAFEMADAREGLRGEVFNQFAEDHAGANITWDAKLADAQTIREELINNNPRGKNNGLNYYTSNNNVSLENEIKDTKARKDLVKKIKNVSKNITEDQAAVAAAIIEIGGRTITGKNLTQYLQDHYTSYMFGTAEDLEQNKNVQATQKKGATIMGATIFKPSTDFAKAAIYIGEKGDLTTLMHETAHSFREQLKLNPELNKQAEEAFQVQNGDWFAPTFQTVTGKMISPDEAFSYGFEDYLTSGKAQNEQMRNIFQKLAEYFAQLFNALKSHIALNPEIMDVYNKLLQGNDSTLAKAQAALQSVKQEEAEAQFQEDQKAQREQITEKRQEQQRKEEAKAPAQDIKTVQQEAAEDTLTLANIPDVIAQEEIDALINGTQLEQTEAIESAAEDAANQEMDIFQMISWDSVKEIADQSIKVQLAQQLKNAMELEKSYAKSMRDYSAQQIAERIKVATGWEKINGTWKYETDDSINSIKGTKAFTAMIEKAPNELVAYTMNNEITLGECIEAEDLYKMFPWLKDARLEFTINGDLAASHAELTAEGILINLAKLDRSERNEFGLIGVLSHEVQHLIQANEYAHVVKKGGDYKALYNGLYEASKDLDITGSYDEAQLANLPAAIQNEAEIEARRVARRVSKSWDEKRRSSFQAEGDISQRESVEDIRFQLIGELGATNLDRAEEVTVRIDNLNVAQEMEKAGKDAKTIRLATGWEKGVDNNWRYETEDDYKLKNTRATNGNARYEKQLKEAQRVVDNLNNDETKNIKRKQIADMVKRGVLPEGTTLETQLEEAQAKVDYFKMLLELDTSLDIESALPRLIERGIDPNDIWDIGAGESFYLKDLIDNPTLFKAYPELEKYTIAFSRVEDGGMYGYFSPEEKSFTIFPRGASSFSEFKSTLSHEVQHAIQGIEGFAAGGSPETATDIANRIKDAFDIVAFYKEIEEQVKTDPETYNYNQIKVLSDIKKEYREAGAEDWLPSEAVMDKAFNYWARGYGIEEEEKIVKQNHLDEHLPHVESDFINYKRLAGEVEARNVEARMNMSPTERLNTLIADTMDVVPEQQIIMYDAVKMASEDFNEVVQEVDDNQLQELINSTVHSESRKAYIQKMYIDRKSEYTIKSFTSSDGKLVGEIEVINKRDVKQDDVDVALYFVNKGYKVTLLPEGEEKGVRNTDALLNENVLIEFKRLISENPKNIANEIKDAANKKNSEIISILLIDNAKNIPYGDIIYWVNKKQKYGDFIADFDNLLFIKDGIISKAVKNLASPASAGTGHDLNISQINDSVNQNNNFNKLDTEYETAVKNGDIEKAKELLRNAAIEKGYAEPSDYKDAHVAPAASVEKKDFTNLDLLREMNDDGYDVNLYAIANGIMNVPEDFFEHPERFGYGDSVSRQAAAALKSAMRAVKSGNIQAATVTVYRAVPNEIKEGQLQSNGQWVTPAKQYAINHGDARFGDGNYRIIEQEVPATDLWFDFGDIKEWGYDDGTEGNVYKNTQANRKSLQITYNDEGHLIPLSERFDENNEDIRYQVVEDPEEIKRLEAEPTVKAYRAMQLIDGGLYPPMSAKVGKELRDPIQLNKWERADENPDMADDNGFFALDKGNGKKIKARYNPYFHSSPTMLNDQFSEAQDRPNLVTVEVEIPESELNSDTPYWAEKAKDAVGAKQWKAGIIQAQLTGTRTVNLSRWDKPIRIVPESEVAENIIKTFDGKNIIMPSNVVPPKVRIELEKRGVQFVETTNKGVLKEGLYAGDHYSKHYGAKVKSEDAKIIDRMAFQTLEELYNDAKQFDSWQEFMGFYESFGKPEVTLVPEDADAQYYQTTWELAHGMKPESEINEEIVEEKNKRDGMSEAVKDALFTTDMASREGMLDDFILRLGEIMNIDTDHWQAMDAEDEADRNATAELQDFITTQFNHPIFLSNAKRLMNGNELTEQAKKIMVGLMRAKPRDYRAIYSQIMGDDTYAVPQEDTVTEQLKNRLSKYNDLVSPNEDIERMSPERRKALWDELDNREIANKIRNGSLKLDDELDKYIKHLDGQIKDLKAQYTELEKATQEDYQNIADAERRDLLRLHEKLQIARSKYNAKNDEITRKISKGLKISDKYTRESQNLKANYNELFRKFSDLKATIEINAQVEAALKRQEELAHIREDLNAKQKEKSVTQEVKKLRIQLVKRTMRRVPFDRIDYDDAKTIIAIQRILEPNLMGGVNRWIGTEGPFLRGVISGILTDADYRKQIENYVEKNAASSEQGRNFLNKIRNLKSVADFDEWTMKERKYALQHLPKENWVRELNLEKLAKEREESIDLPIETVEKQKPMINEKTGEVMTNKNGDVITQTTWEVQIKDNDIVTRVKDAIGEDMYNNLINVPFADWTTEQLEELAMRVNALYKQGRDILEAKKKAQVEAADQVRRQIEAVVKDTGIVINDDDTPEEKKRKQDKINKILGLNNNLKGTNAAKEESGIKARINRLLHGYNDANVLRVARILDGQKEGANVTELYRKEDDCYNAKTRSINGRAERINKVLQENNISTTDLAQTVNVDGRDFTIDELLYFAAADKDFVNDEAKIQKGAKADTLAANDDFAATSRNAVMFGNMLSDTESTELKQRLTEEDKEMQRKLEEDDLTTEERQSLILKTLDKAPGTTAYIAKCKERYSEVLKAVKELDPKYQALLEAISNDYSDQYERMNEISVKEFNTPVHRVKAYVPLVRLESNGDTNINQVKEDLLAAYGAGAGKQWVNKGMTQRRVNMSPLNQKPVQTGLYKTWADSVDRTEHFIAYAPYVRELNRVYKSRDAQYTRQCIENRYGKGMIKYIDDYINEVANPNANKVREAGAELLHTLRGKTAPAYLAWKASAIIKQGLTSPWPYMQFVNPAEYLAASMKCITSRGAMYDAIREKSVFMNNRVFDPMADLIDEMAEKTGSNKVTMAINNFNKKGMAGLEWIDWVSVAPGWLACYEKEYARLNGKNTAVYEATKARLQEENLTADIGTTAYKTAEQIEAIAQKAMEDDLEMKAIQYADDCTRQCQPSNRSVDISPLFKNSSEAMKAYLQFQTSLNVIWQNLRYDMPYATKQKEFSRITGCIIGYVLAGVFMNSVMEGYDDDDDKEALALRQALYYATTQFSDSVPMLGSEITNTLDKLITGKSSFYGTGTDLTPTATKFFAILTNAKKGNWEKAAEMTAEGIGMYMGLPVSGMKELKKISGIGNEKLEPGVHLDEVYGILKNE